jgi:hypothetical protein
MIPSVPANKDGTCPTGSHSVGSSGNAGQPGSGSITCLSDKPPTPTPTPTPSTQSQKSQLPPTPTPTPTPTPSTQSNLPIVVKQLPGGGCPSGYHLVSGVCIKNIGTTTGTTTATTTGKPTPPPPPTTSSSSKTVTKAVNNKNVIRGGQPTSSTGTSATTAAAPSQAITNNNFLIYANTLNKITIRYPSTWTKTELVGNPSIPVIFNAPITADNTAAAKTTLMISINTLTNSKTATLDGFAQEQNYALTHSNTIKYTITDRNAKALTPPSGVGSAFREISYDGIKNTIDSVNKIATQVPLKGTAIYFVNDGIGYRLLYLAKQTEFAKNLPIVQQMINSFQIAGIGGVSSSGNTNAASSGGGGGPVATPSGQLSQPECTPGFHWDKSQQKCVANTAKGP